MKDKLKIGAYVVLGLVAMFVIGLYWLGWQKFFAPKQANIQREVFEHTQSYVHGAARDLAAYYEQYTKAGTAEDKEAIRQVVIMRFANLDAGLIDNSGLRSFLTNMRGY